MKTLKLKLDDADYESILEAVAIRKSGLFRVDGKLILPESKSDHLAAIVAEVCRGWIDRMTADLVAQMRAQIGNGEALDRRLADLKGGE